MADLDAATVDDVRAFFAQHYAPNNAVLVIAGDVTPAAVLPMVQQYFGRIPAGPRREAVTCETAPGPSRAVVKRITDANATLPAVLMVYRTVPPAHADYPALALLTTILGEGESSRLNRSLVRGSQVAVAAQTLHDPFGPMRAGGIFAVLAIANAAVGIDSLHAALERETLLAADGISADELDKARSAWRSRTIFGRQTALDVSEAVQYAALYLGSPSAVNAEAARYGAVTVSDLQRVARTYLRAESALTMLISSEAR
jgi:zinc protease